MTDRDKSRRNPQGRSGRGKGAQRPAPRPPEGQGTSKRAGRRPPGAVRRGERSWDDVDRGSRTDKPARPSVKDQYNQERDDREREKGKQRSGRPPGAVRRGERSLDKVDRVSRAVMPARPPLKELYKQERDDRKREKREQRAGRPPGVGRGHIHGKGARHKAPAPSDGLIRLNRYLAQSGICSRREADDLIKAGVVTVNGQVVTELGTKVMPGDKVHYGGQRISMETKRYVLLNKPKGFITTTEDERDRRTVMALVAAACPERIYPVGRLDRNTTGVLLMTNDGDLAKKLTHPSHGAEKIYHVELDKAVTKAHMQQLVQGVQLDDGPARADEVDFVTGATKREVGVKLHMGRNRIVRRMFESLGYQVVKLDRVVFAGLTKKDLPRGKWRHLTEKEVLFLSKRR